MVFKNPLKKSQSRYYNKVLQEKLEKLTEPFEESYYKRLSQKLSSTCTSSKCYWFFKIPVIQPLFHNNNFISNLKEKSEVFNEHFSKQFFDTK